MSAVALNTEVRVFNVAVFAVFDRKRKEKLDCANVLVKSREQN